MTPPRAVATVMVVEPDPVIDGGLKLATAPPGSPDDAKVTVPRSHLWVIPSRHRMLQLLQPPKALWRTS